MLQTMKIAKKRDLGYDLISLQHFEFYYYFKKRDIHASYVTKECKYANVC